MNTLIEMVYVDLETKKVTALIPTLAFGALLDRAMEVAPDKPLFLTPLKQESVGVGGDGGESNSA
ncbi:hypothetical protein [Dehalogenimonas sp. 4OHTPN]|uniref:Uncharacterized protein n=1 Tax=Dehalogenimonas sp. 4OHTPN TaxID=3166643 RepID=A0AAU8GA56_9CHLR